MNSVANHVRTVTLFHRHRERGTRSRVPTRLVAVIAKSVAVRCRHGCRWQKGGNKQHRGRERCGEPSGPEATWQLKVHRSSPSIWPSSWASVRRGPASVHPRRRGFTATYRARQTWRGTSTDDAGPAHGVPSPRTLIDRLGYGCRAPADGPGATTSSQGDFDEPPHSRQSSSLACSHSSPPRARASDRRARQQCRSRRPPQARVRRQQRSPPTLRPRRRSRPLRPSRRPPHPPASAVRRGRPDLPVGERGHDT